MTQRRPIPDHGEYEAGDDGFIYRNGRRLSTRAHRNGYRVCTLSVAGRIMTRYVHRLVCSAFHGPQPSPAHEVRHLDGTRDNNVPGNVQWSTKAENEADKIVHGTLLWGERAPGAKLDDATVIEMRTLARELGSIQEVAKRYGIHEGVAADAITGRRWKHLPGALPAYETRRKFTDDEVREIRLGALSNAKTAKRYGVALNTIWQIRNRVSYAHVI